MLLHVLTAATQPRAAQLAAPSPVAVQHAATLRDQARRRAIAAWLPRVLVRFTYRNAAAETALGREDPLTAWRWPLALGATLEFRAVWGFDLLAPRGRASLPALPAPAATVHSPPDLPPLLTAPPSEEP